MGSTNTISAPTIFQTYLLPAIPFRRRKSSTDTNASTSSSSTSSSPSSSPISPLTEPYFDLSPPTPTIPSFLGGHTSRISCSRCHADLALTSQIISKGFTGRHGRAYLVSAQPSSTVPSPTLSGCKSTTPSSPITLPNTNTHKPVPRHLVTGLHTVCDISCALCGTVLGWKYVSAEDESQRYKVGKFILETRRVVVGSCWEDGEESDVTEYEEQISETTSSGHGVSRKAPISLIHIGTIEGSSGSTSSSNSSSTRLKGTVEEEIMFDSQDEDECEDLFAGVWSPQLARRRRNRRVNLRI